MPVQLKGEVAVNAGGDQFTLLLDFNALCAVETELGIDMMEIGENMRSLPTIRSLFRIALEARHGKMTDLEAGNIIQKIGVVSASELLGKAVEASFPDAADAGGNVRAPAPQATGRGTRKKR
ncbi:hypothetical protein [Sphingomonas sanxanigenens]|uniref:Uncharacterized protein n=1 Tax=Sphingomonas sanxanigenens DSM 19645 = NX02 TaxID=1123269 RepID=W0AJW6_9SPHN|nr:hypothetical protein [Sphingomonas sanxanigenens]AHE57431.1 hypothetical protein NX02_29335 [Sphingomonas sanxanigenens DSM 19645 = NX02]